MRDIERQLKLRPQLNEIFRAKLFLAGRVHKQERGQRGAKVYSLHAPEVECIGKGKAHNLAFARLRVRALRVRRHCRRGSPRRQQAKLSIATPVVRCAGGQFVLAAKALRGNPYDGHTLTSVIPHVEKMVGYQIKRIVADKGYRGHGGPYHLRVFVTQQKRGVTKAIKRELKRRAAVEPVIGHMKNEHRLDRNYLIGRHGDASNAALAAVGYNFARLLAWLRGLWHAWLALLLPAICAAGRAGSPIRLRRLSYRYFTDNYLETREADLWNLWNCTEHPASSHRANWPKRNSCAGLTIDHSRQTAIAAKPRVFSVAITPPLPRQRLGRPPRPPNRFVRRSRRCSGADYTGSDNLRCSRAGRACRLPLR